MPNYVKNVLTVSGVPVTRFYEICGFVVTDDGKFDFEKIMPTPKDLMIADRSKGSTLENYYQHLCTPKSEFHPSLGISKDLFDHIRMTEENWYKLGCPNPEDAERYLSEDGKELLSLQIGLHEDLQNLVRTQHENKDDEYPALLIGYFYTQNRLYYGYPTWHKWRVEKWGTKWNAMDSRVLPEGFGWEFMTAWDAPTGVVETLSKIFPDVLFTLEYADEDLGRNCGKIGYQAGLPVYIYHPEEQSDAALKLGNRLWDGERSY